jgi:hypothetical protein
MKKEIQMTTLFNFIQNDWTNIKNKCRTTVNKSYSYAKTTTEFKKQLLISEHSPIRLLTVDWSWKGIPSWVATHWSRHKFEKFISTQRSDRTGVDRNELPQGALVNFDGNANAQNLIDVWRKRLCFCSADETRKLAESFKIELHDLEPELANVLVPNCVYRCGCPEFKPCGYWQGFVERYFQEDLAEIQERYNLYNKEFYD